MAKHTRCGCNRYCGDLPESKDDARAVCKGLPCSPEPPLVRVALKLRQVASERGGGG